MDECLDGLEQLAGGQGGKASSIPFVVGRRWRRGRLPSARFARAAGRSPGSTTTSGPARSARTSDAPAGTDTWAPGPWPAGHGGPRPNAVGIPRPTDRQVRPRSARRRPPRAAATGEGHASAPPRSRSVPSSTGWAPSSTNVPTPAASSAVAASANPVSCASTFLQWSRSPPRCWSAPPTEETNEIDGEPNVTSCTAAGPWSTSRERVLKAEHAGDTCRGHFADRQPGHDGRLDAPRPPQRGQAELQRERSRRHTGRGVHDRAGRLFTREELAQRHRQGVAEELVALVDGTAELRLALD